MNQVNFEFLAKHFFRTYFVYFSTDICGTGMTYVDGICRESCNGGDSCCTQNNPCVEGEGDCDDNSNCKNGLTCDNSFNNCLDNEFGTKDDCCYNPAH